MYSCKEPDVASERWIRQHARIERGLAELGSDATPRAGWDASVLAATSTTVRVPQRVVLVVALAIVLAGVSLWMAYP